MSEIEILQKILDKITSIENNLMIIKDSFLWVIGISVGILVLYILYRVLYNFMCY